MQKTAPPSRRMLWRSLHAASVFRGLDHHRRDSIAGELRIQANVICMNTILMYICFRKTWPGFMAAGNARCDAGSTGTLCR
jgi:hypothetical protein